jgi:hypothetical protein
MPIVSCFIRLSFHHVDCDLHCVGNLLIAIQMFYRCFLLCVGYYLLTGRDARGILAAVDSEIQQVLAVLPHLPTGTVAVRDSIIAIDDVVHQTMTST